VIPSLAEKLEGVIFKYQATAPSAAVPEWILPPLSCAFLESVAAVLPAPLNAFEFGSGRSTHALRRVSSQTTSVENSAEWLDRTENGESARRATDYSAVIPLQRCWNRTRLIESFDVESRPEVLSRLRQSHLILVDSPPNPAKREHALFLALCHAPINAVIVLDDLEVRAVSRFASRLAQQNAARFRFWKLNIDHQLGVFLKVRTGSIRSIPTPREFLGTWMRA
jgi:hypothetical protein